MILITSKTSLQRNAGPDFVLVSSESVITKIYLNTTKHGEQNFLQLIPFRMRYWRLTVAMVFIIFNLKRLIRNFIA